jgi:hypothetical protein
MSSDFRTKQIQTKQIITSGSLGSTNSGARLVVYPIEVQGTPYNTGEIDQNLFNTSSLDGQDIFLYVSGGIREKSSAARSITVFGGDTMVSGVLHTDDILTTANVLVLTSSLIGVVASSDIEILNSEAILIASSQQASVYSSFYSSISNTALAIISSSVASSVNTSFETIIKDSSFSSTLSAQSGLISGSTDAAILASGQSTIMDDQNIGGDQQNVSIISSRLAEITNNSAQSSIISSHTSTISGSYEMNDSTSMNILGSSFSSNILNGNINTILSTNQSSISNANITAIIAGVENIISGSDEDFNNSVLSTNAIIGGGSNIILGNTKESVILGGFTNIMTSSATALIANSATSSMSTVSQGTIIGSKTATIINGERLFIGSSELSYVSSTINGSNNSLINSAIIASEDNQIKSDDEFIHNTVLVLGSYGTVVSNSNSTVLLGSKFSTVENSNTIGLLATQDNTISSSNNSVINGGRNNEIYNSDYSSIMGGRYSIISNSIGVGAINSRESIIIDSSYASNVNTIESQISASSYSTNIASRRANIKDDSDSVVIISSQDSEVSGSYRSSVLSSFSSFMSNSGYSAIIGGNNNKISNSENVILIGSELTSSVSNTILLGGTSYTTIVSGGLTGSLQKTINGNSYIIGGPNITVVTNSLGQIEISGSAGGGSSVQWVESTTVPRLRTTASVAIGSGSFFAQDISSSVFFYVSGSKFDERNISLFGGDLHINGNLIQELTTSKNTINVNNQVTVLAANSNTITQSNQIILAGGDSNSLTTVKKTFIAAGDSNIISDNTNGFGKIAIIAGDSNTITGRGAFQGTWSAIIAGRNNIFNSPINSAAVASYGCTFNNGTLNASLGVDSSQFQGTAQISAFIGNSNSVISGGVYGAAYDVIAGGTNHSIIDATWGGIFAGTTNTITYNYSSVIVGGDQNTISGSDSYANNGTNIIGGGGFNSIIVGSERSSIFGGIYNGITTSLNASIMNSSTSSISGSNSSIIIGGTKNKITSVSGTFIIGSGITSSLNNTIILGGTRFQTIVSGGLTGSLQKTINGNDYIIGGPNINIVTNSLGQVEISSSNGYRYATTFKTASYTVTTNERFIYVSASTSVTMSLPTTPSEGQSFIFKDKAGNALTNNIVISSSNSTIDGNSTFNLNINYGSVEVVYMSSSATPGWGII